MDNPEIETQTHFILRFSAWVAAIDIATFTLAALACVLTRATLTLHNFSNSLCICGFIVIFVGFEPPEGLRKRPKEWTLPGLSQWSLARRLESNVPSRYLAPAPPRVALTVAGVIALISSIVLPLVF